MTPAQLDANRTNAQRSTGPVSDAGKHSVSRNAVKHGLTGATHAALPGEESALEQHCRGFRKSYAPVGIVEESLVRAIAENYWRLRRAHAMEHALFERAMLEDPAESAAALADAWIDPAKGMQRVALYAARIQRAIDKATADLKALQSDRKAACQNARDEAILLTKLASAKGNAFDPALHFGPPETCGGFVYSSDEIMRAIIRADKLEEARACFAPREDDAIM